MCKRLTGTKGRPSPATWPYFQHHAGAVQLMMASPHTVYAPTTRQITVSTGITCCHYFPGSILEDGVDNVRALAHDVLRAPAHIVRAPAHRGVFGHLPILCFAMCRASARKALKQQFSNKEPETSALCITSTKKMAECKTSPCSVLGSCT